MRKSFSLWAVAAAGLLALTAQAEIRDPVRLESGRIRGADTEHHFRRADTWPDGMDRYPARYHDHHHRGD